MEKPCRTCTDFKTWVKLQQQTFDSGKVCLIEILKKKRKKIEINFLYSLFIFCRMILKSSKQIILVQTLLPLNVMIVH